MVIFGYLDNHLKGKLLKKDLLFLKITNMQSEPVRLISGFWGG